ncbi:Mas-related G-protein coupled receptor member D [Myotis brandtii]|uniref:Mas-related G-protein coupled receptor member D n=1 Tax=Myotis brandtii TaxID=109478 RepID=S7PF87_MYOBR|nr:Mas-related G-protein coupled receptor member D [Myotis brandtii]
MASLLSLEAANAHPVAYEVLRRVKYFAYTVGLSMLTAISTLRCVSVVCPVWHRQHQSPRLSAWVCAALWTLSLVMNTLAAVFCSKYWRSDENQCFVVDAVLSVLILGIFTPVMTVSSATLFVQVVRLYSCLSRLSAAVSCGANPLIYFLVGSRHVGPREPLEAVLQRALQEAPELEGRETPSGYNNEEGV